MNRKTTLTWAGDAGKMILSLILKSESLGVTYNISTNETLFWREIAQIYTDVFGLEIVPVLLKRFKTLNLNPYQLHYDRMFDRICSNEKILSINELKDYKCKSAREALSYELNQTDLSKWSNSFTRIHGRMDKILGINRINKAFANNSGISYLLGYNSLLNYFYGIFSSLKFS